MEFSRGPPQSAQQSIKLLFAAAAYSNYQKQGSVTIGPDEIVGNYDSFQLSESDGDSVLTRETQTTLQCPSHVDWFFENPPQMYPTSSPTTSRAAAQHFQRGQMIWLKEGDTYYVLYHTDLRLADGHQGSSDLKSLLIIPGPLQLKPGVDPDNRVGEDPPADTLEPLHGFGLIWRREVEGAEDVHQQLGWAPQTETGEFKALWNQNRKLQTGRL